MNRKQALTDLLAKVEAGNKVSFNDFCDHWERAFALGSYNNSWRAYNGSLDAAMALHEAVLPDWVVGQMQKFESGRWYFKIYHPLGDEWPKWTPFPSHEASNDSPARAWLIAILKALIAQEDAA